MELSFAIIYQDTDEIPGGTAGAVRNEATTGEFINGGHWIKAGDTINRLNTLIDEGKIVGAHDLNIAIASSSTSRTLWTVRQMKNLVYSSLNEELFHRFPDLQKPPYEELMVDIHDGPHIVFGTLFNRYLVDLVGSSHESLEQAALFLEERWQSLKTNESLTC
ncbi:hypothetical protein [Tunturiibacter gelidiferens]|uniref:Uncharacterized protein n=1 Tax=Tunturiibacter gelidiferens TaxID=3069689 RepID=A0AAU7Z145_9BACT